MAENPCFLVTLQVKKLVQKLVSRDTLSYRKLTDKPVAVEEGDKKTEDSTKPESVSKVLPDDKVLSQGKFHMRNNVKCK